MSLPLGFIAPCLRTKAYGATDSQARSRFGVSYGVSRKAHWPALAGGRGRKAAVRPSLRQRRPYIPRGGRSQAVYSGANHEPHASSETRGEISEFDPAQVVQGLGVVHPVVGSANFQALHLYMSSVVFARLKDDYNLRAVPGHSIRYFCGVRDEVINQIGLSVLSEVMSPTAAGRMLVETSSLLLAAASALTLRDRAYPAAHAVPASAG
jgi:hypothetical protein